MKPPDRKAALILADYFDGRGEFFESLQEINSPLSRHALRIILQGKNEPSLFGEILRLAELSGDISCYSDALNLIKDYADGGNVPASVFLADMYNYGLGVSRDSFMALKYYRVAGFGGDFYSQNMCVNIILTSQDYTYQPPEPVRISPEEQYQEGMKLYNAKQYTEALEMFRLSAESGNPSAEYMTGRMHEHAQGVSRNVDKAKEYYARAAEKGHSGAKKALKRLSGKKFWWPF